MGCLLPLGRNGCVGCAGCVLPLALAALCLLGILGLGWGRHHRVAVHPMASTSAISSSVSP